MGLYGLAASLLVVWSIFLGTTAYYKGRDSRSSEVAEYQAAIKASEIAAREATDRAEKAAAKVVVEYRDRVKVIEKRLPGEIQLIETIRETSNCPVPDALVELWNGGTSPDGQDAKGSGGVDGAPVTLAEVAEAAAEAKRRFEVNAARLEALQEIVKSQ